MDLHKLLFLNLMPGSLTVMFRRKDLPKTLPNWFYMAFNGDWCLLFIISQKGMIHFLDEPTAIYREGVGVISSTNNLIKFKNGLKSNKELNKYTNYQYDYHIGNYLFHYKNITYSYFENKKKIIGFLWFLKTTFYCVFSKKTVWKESNMFVFFKSVIKLFLYG